MSVQNDGRTAPTAEMEQQRSRGLDLLTWPYSGWLCGIAIILLYLPVLMETSRYWFQNDNFAHGIFIFPLSAALLWLQRDQIAAAKRAPVAGGLLVLAMGLAMGAGSYLLHIKFVGIWSLIPVLAGTLLVLHGKELWMVARFPVCFLFWAGPLPAAVYGPISAWIQTISTRGAAELMTFLGYTLLRIGNQIQLPGYALEVAEACSGFKKLIALIAFSLLYGYMFPIGWVKRLILLFCAIPIALLANVLRVSALIAVCSAGRETALHRAHDLAEFGALIFSFLLFVMVGKLLKCNTPKFSI